MKSALVEGKKRKERNSKRAHLRNEVWKANLL
jgi:hypothetical protein